jgi:hypothetical protein
MPYSVSGDIIPIACCRCGRPTGFVPNRPGRYKVGCENCGATTDAQVSSDGTMQTW